MNKKLIKSFRRAIYDLGRMGDLLEKCTKRSVRKSQSDKQRFNPQRQIRRTFRIPFRLALRTVVIAFQGLWFPVKLFLRSSRERRKECLMGLPALAALVLIAVAGFRVWFQGEEFASVYRTKGVNSLRSGDFNSAKTYLGRVVQSPYVTENDQFNFALSMIRSDEEGRGRQLMDQLASNDSADEPGYPAAHRFKALEIVSRGLGSSDHSSGFDGNLNTVQQLRLHLERAGELSGLHDAWATYYLAINQKTDAVNHLRLAAKDNPDRWVSLAELYRQMGNEQQYRTTLIQAKGIFARLVNQQPEDSPTRIALANIENRLGNYQVAEELLLTGVAIGDGRQLRQALANFYVNQHDLACEQDQSFAIRFQHIQSALTHDNQHIPAYNRLVFNYQKVASNAELDSIKNELAQMITDGKSLALSHFSISNIYWIEQNFERATWHMEQAYRHDESFSNVANNLAWILTHQEQPDLVRAHELINHVVSQFPEDSRFRDTLATVLMKQEQYNEAATEFERCLSQFEDRKVIHQKLAFVYDKLGNSQMTRQHQEAVERLSRHQ